jgi:hypothetical protein
MNQGENIGTDRADVVVMLLAGIQEVLGSNVS